MNVFYSTPSCYLNALHESNIEWPEKTEDYFPYANDPHAYWSGYYTSRPTSKRFERTGNEFLQICKKLSASAKTPEAFYTENLNRLRDEMGVMQHHDAITGTEKQAVANDYHRELYRTIVGCEENTKSSLNQFVLNRAPSTTPWPLEFNSCLQLNISSCPTSENSELFMVTAYNPLAHETNQFVRFPVGGSGYTVHTADSVLVPSQIVPVPTAIKDLPHRLSTTTNELVFQAVNVPAMGFKSFYVTRTASVSASKATKLAEAVTIGNSELSISFDTNGLLSSITVDGETNKLEQNFVMYQGSGGNNNGFENRASGAYIFRPDPLAPVTTIGTDVTVSVVRGELVEEVHQVFNDYISQVVRVYKNEKLVEFEWLVGPIPVEDSIGKEYVSRFYTDIQSGDEFETDSNGREILKRKRDYRQDFELTLEEPVAGNYYPINTKIAIEDATHRLAVVTDRAQGGSSIVDGTVELMVRFPLPLNAVNKNLAPSFSTFLGPPKIAEG